PLTGPSKLMSVTTTSGRESFKIPRASSAEAAHSTSKSAEESASFTRARISGSSSTNRSLLGMGLLAREVQREQCAPPLFVDSFDPSAVIFGDGLRDEQADSAVGSARLVRKGLE